MPRANLNERIRKTNAMGGEDEDVEGLDGPVRPKPAPPEDEAVRVTSKLEAKTV